LCASTKKVVGLFTFILNFSFNFSIISKFIISTFFLLLLGWVLLDGLVLLFFLLLLVLLLFDGLELLLTISSTEKLWLLPPFMGLVGQEKRLFQAISDGLG